MDSIPNEVLQQIFTYLSHRNRAQCSLVNKKWYSITRQPLFYKTIRIFNKAQLKKFIHMASTFYLHNHLVGYYVERLLFENYHIGWRHEDEALTRDLNIACPNVTYIYSVPDLNDYKLYDFPLWPNLQTLPLWFQKRDKEWHQRICNKNSPYTSLAFEINNDIVTQNDDHDYRLVLTTEEEENEKEWDKVFILLEKDEYKAVRKLVDYPLAKRDGIHDTEIINDEHYAEYSGTTLSFEPKVKANFRHLKELSINFRQNSNANPALPLNSRMEIDERTIENIHQTCPVLESLTLLQLLMNISNQYLQNKTILPSSSSVINACTSLKTLNLFQISFLHPVDAFHYFSKKYPYLITLNMDVIVRRVKHQSIEFKRKYKSALMIMITHYPYLTTLVIQLIRKRINNIDSAFRWEKDLWHSAKFLKWLRQHPTQLTSLKYPFAFHAIEDDCDFGIIYQYKAYPTIYLEKTIIIDISKEEEEEEIKQHYTYLDHLKELILKFEHNLNLTYQYLLLIKKRHYTSFSNLTSLHIKYNFFDDGLKKRYDTFYFYSWLKLIPHLKKLHLEMIKHLYLDPTWDTMDDILEYAGDIIYVEEQIINHGKVNNHTQSNKLLRVKHQQQGPFPLEELILTNCIINSLYVLTHISQSCPSLRVLKLKEVRFFQHQEEMNEEDVTKIQLNGSCIRLDYDVLINMSHLGLDELVIDHCAFRNLYSFWCYSLKNLVVQEMKHKTSFALPPEFGSRDNTTIVFICKYVDSVYFS